MPEELTAFPWPDRIEIEGDEGGGYLVIRLRGLDEFCGDTWHRTIDEAISGAEAEYGQIRWEKPQ